MLSLARQTPKQLLRTKPSRLALTRLVPVDPWRVNNLWEVVRCLIEGSRNNDSQCSAFGQRSIWLTVGRTEAIYGDTWSSSPRACASILSLQHFTCENDASPIRLAVCEGCAQGVVQLYFHCGTNEWGIFELKFVINLPFIEPTNSQVHAINQQSTSTS
jgi:hypothetical protein